MSIRVKLLLSYIVMLILPVFLFLIAILMMGFAFFGDIKNTTRFYNIDLKEPHTITRLIYADDIFFTELKDVAKYAPQKLEDPRFLRGMDRELNKVQSGLIIRQGRQLVYTSPFFRDPAIIHALPPVFQKKVNDEEDEHEHHEIRVHHHWYSYKQYDFFTQDHQVMTIFILRDVSTLTHLARKFFRTIIITLFLALAVTNGLLTYLVSRSILKPLNVLKHATEQIKEENLDFRIVPTSKDELGELSLAFEEMRQKLKESIDLQLQYEENRKELISNISHDLKTPLTAIKGYVEGIRDGVADTPEKIEKYLSIIAKKAEDMDQLIDELFLFSKLDLKKLPFFFEHVEIVKYLDECIEEVKFDLEKHGISIKWARKIAPTIVIADREKLKRVIMNIIGNSVKFMNKTKGEIGFSLIDKPEKVVIQITDNGPGIDPEALPFIFDRFYRIDKSRNSLTGGSGLGLAIAKQIIEEHKGEIWAKSELNKGTTISFTLQKASKRTKGGSFEKDPDH
ncbi:sensor histidine kinase [Polycladomyces subterraneus]|uniref:histidine kinase n=1 Tax=Polycladomyces subterraneus TaxID=1016997 RepID=A0ABT8IQN9_9BACL|nr:HAMP domain-containing sensor histidine kinase [Polycladomyces subterraneus]MDN4595115.1 HAMP domain-containing histidine kinase [Polycladomyces subterraneus]